MMTQAISSVEVTGGDAMASLVHRARQEGRPLVDYGLAHRHLGHAPPTEHTRLRQSVQPGDDGVIEHYVRDLTVRAAAGATMGQLNAALLRVDQFLPVDADDDLTLGEVIMHDVYGPLRAGFGSVRDWLLGLRYIDGEGRDIHVGGRTVKNVAGYDVTRLMVGSLGELGAVYEATLRTAAVPRTIRVAMLSLEEPAALSQAGTNWLLSDAAPAGLSMHWRRGEMWRVRAAYFSSDVGCDVQVNALRHALATLAGPTARLVHVRDRTLGQDCADRAADRAWRREVESLVKIVVPPVRTGEACAALATMHDGSLRIDALPLHGCIFAGGELDASQTVALDKRIAELLRGMGGFRVWYNRGTATDIEPFAPPQSDYALLCRLKIAMDPHNIFNPGRYLKQVES